MKRKIIHIDREKCNGCGACVDACHEGAIALADGKAILTREDYCDGLGACLPQCPTGALTLEERDVPAYNELAASESQKAMPHAGCPGSRSRMLSHACRNVEAEEQRLAASELGQWPCQIKLVPANAPYLAGAKLLIAADCAAYAYAGFHRDFMRGKITIIGCPKLDGVDYAEKLTAIIRENDIQSVTLVRMEVPCCGGLESALKRALVASGKMIPWQVVTISVDGRILD